MVEDNLVCGSSWVKFNDGGRQHGMCGIFTGFVESFGIFSGISKECNSGHAFSVKMVLAE